MDFESIIKESEKPIHGKTFRKYISLKRLAIEDANFSPNTCKALLALGIKYVDDLMWDHMKELSEFADVKILEELVSHLNRMSDAIMCVDSALQKKHTF